MQPTTPPSYHSGTEGSLETVWEGSWEKIVRVSEQPKLGAIPRVVEPLLPEFLEKKIFENSEKIRITLDQTTQGMQNRMVELQTGISQKFVRDDEKNSRLLEDVKKKIQTCQGHMEGHLANFQVGVAQKMTDSEKKFTALRGYTRAISFLSRGSGASRCGSTGNHQNVPTKRITSKCRCPNHPGFSS